MPVTLVGGILDQDLVVNYEVDVSDANGNTAEAADFASVSGSVTVEAGASEALVELQIVDDAAIEPAETFTVKLTGTTALTGSNSDVVVQVEGEVTGTIASSDGAVLGIELADAAGPESNPLRFAVTLVGGTVNEDINVRYTVEHGIPGGTDLARVTNDRDFGPGFASGSFQIKAHQTSATLEITPVSDNLLEHTESFTVKLVPEQLVLADDGSPMALVHAASATGGFAVGTIENDDGLVLIAEVSDAAADEGSNLSFTVELTGNTDVAGRGTVSGNYTVTHGTTSSSDFTGALSGTFSIPPTATSTTVTVAAADDAIAELAETFTLSLTSIRASGTAQVVILDIQDTGTGTISASDGAVPTVTVADAEATEGSNLSFQATLTNGPLAQALTVNYSVTADSTADRADFSGGALPAGGSFTIAAGSTQSQAVTIATNADSAVEVNETFTVALTGFSYAVANVSVDVSDTATGTIIDNDGTVLVAALNHAGTSDGGTVSFPVGLEGFAAGEVVTVEYELTNLTTKDGDFPANAKTGSVTLTAGAAGPALNISTANNSAEERNEAFKITLTGASTFNPDQTVAVEGSAVGSIASDNQPEVSISDESKTEDATGNLTFTVTLGAAVDYQVRVAYRTEDITATAGEDYTSASGTLKFAPGETTKTIAVTTAADDNYAEPDETFQVVLADPLGASLALDSNGEPDAGSGTISNDDGAAPVVSLSASATTVAEGGQLTYSVSVPSSPSTPRQAIEVSYELVPANSSLTAGDDYTAPTGTVTIPASATSQTITIQTLNDDLPEAGEIFTLRLTLAKNAVLAAAASDREAAGTITDNDEPVFVGIRAEEAMEGQGLPFTLELSRPLSEAVTVQYTVQASAAMTFDIAGFDPNAASNALVIPAGAVRRTFKAFIADDHQPQPDRSLTVTLLSAGAYTDLGSLQSATGAIHDNDRPNYLTITAGRAREGNVVPFTARLSRPVGQAVNFSYRTKDGTATSASNYTAVTNGTGTIAAGATSETFHISTGQVSSDSAFEVELTGITGGGAVLGSSAAATGTIVDLGSSPLIEVFLDQPLDQSNTKAEKTAEGQTVTARFRLSEPLAAAAGQVAVGYRITGGTATAADYQASQASGTITFDGAQRDQQKTFEIQLREDFTDEPDETLTIKLDPLPGSAASYLKWGGQTKATITIEDTDETVAAIADATGEEADGYLAFPVSLSSVADQDVTLTYSTSNGTTEAGHDYTRQTDATVTIAAYTRTATILVPTLDDGLAEPDETLTVQLTGIQGLDTSHQPVRLGRQATAVGTIQDDDTPQVTISDTRVTEGDTATFTARLSKIADAPVTVSYMTQEIDLNNNDYTAVITPREVTFAPGVYSVPINIATTEDTTNEDNVYRPANDNETFQVVLQAVTTGNAQLGYYTHGTGTIIDDDETTRPLVTITPDSATNSTATEGDPITFNVNLSRATNRPLGVVYRTYTGQGGASTADLEEQYVLLRFAAGETSKTISIPTIADTLYEPTEQFEVRLIHTSQTIAKLDSRNTATGTINDQRTITVINGQANESKPVTFTVTLPTIPTEAVVINYATSDGTATAGQDYTSKTGSLTFPANTETLTQTFTVDTIANNDVVGDETFTVTLTNPTSNIHIPTPTATGTIFDKPTITVTAGTPTNDEVPFTVTLSQPVNEVVTVKVAFISAPGGYSLVFHRPQAFTYSFQPNTTSRSLSLRIDSNSRHHRQERAVILVESSDNAQIGNPSMAKVSISGNTSTDEPVATVGLEVHTGTGNARGHARGTITLSKNPTEYVRLYAALLDIPLESSIDTNYPTFLFTVEFSAGTNETTQSYGKFLDRNHKGWLVINTFSMVINNVQPGDPIFAVTKTGERPILTITGGEATEGEDVVFTVALSEALDQDIEVNYTFGEGGTFSATGGTDYDNTTETLTIEAGTIAKTIRVPTKTDALTLEPSETFTVTLTDPGDTARYRLIDHQTATGTIKGLPVLTFINGQSNESHPATFTVTLSEPPEETATINYTTSDGTATAGQDYTSKTGTLTFPANTETLTQTIAVDTIANNDVVGDETFTVTLTNPTNNIYMPTSTATGTIFDKPTITVTAGQRPTRDDPLTLEDERETIPFTITLSQPATETVSVLYALIRTPEAVQDHYYISPISLNPGTTSISVPGTISSDITEDQEFTFLLIRSTANAQIGNPDTAYATVTGTTTNTRTPVLTITSSYRKQLDINDILRCQVEFTYSLSHTSIEAIISADNSYIFPIEPYRPGESLTNGDIIASFHFGRGWFRNRADHTMIRPNLSLCPEGIMAIATATIHNNSARLGNPGFAAAKYSERPTLTVTGGQATEGDDIVFTVALSKVLRQAVEVNYTFSDGTATGGTDYDNTTKTLTFEAGTIAKTIRVPTTADALTSESNETFTVTLTDPGTTPFPLFYLNNNKTATGTIINSATTPGS